MTGAAENAQGSADPGMKPLALGRSRRGLVTLVLGCAAFVAIGVFLLLDDGWAGKLTGLAAVLFFGLCGGYALWKSLREPALLTLTPEGIRVHSGGFLPWADFEAAGMGRVPGAPGGTEVLGIRMKSCERYAASFTSEQLRLARGAAKGGQLSGASLPSAGIFVGRRGADALRSLPQHDLREMLQWNRELTGWEVAFSPLLFAGGASGALAKIQAHHQAVLERRGGSGS